MRQNSSSTRRVKFLRVYPERDKDGSVKRWVATVPPKKPGERPKRVGFGKTAEEADKRRTEWLEREASGRPKITARTHTVSSWLGYWLDETARPRYDDVRHPDRRTAGHEPTTWQNYQHVTEQYLMPYFRDIPLPLLETWHVEEWRDERVAEGDSLCQLNAAIKLLRAALKFAESRSAETGVRSNVAKLVGMPRHVAEEIVPTPEPQLRRLFEVLKGERLQALVTLALGLGLRRQEVLGLKWGAVDLERGLIRIGNRLNRIGGQLKERSGVKMDAERVDTLPLDPAQVAMLHRYRAELLEWKVGLGTQWRGPQNPLSEDAFVFPMHHTWAKRCGLAITPEYLNEWYASMCTKAGMTNTKFHQLRHECAITLLRRRVELWRVSRLLRHKKQETTIDIYGHFAPQDHQETVGVMAGFVAALGG